MENKTTTLNGVTNFNLDIVCAYSKVMDILLKFSVLGHLVA